MIWGNVTQVMEQGGCLARTAVLASDLDESIPGLAINRFCASGMEAVNLAANQVKGGAGDGYIAGGVEMMGRVRDGQRRRRDCRRSRDGDGQLFRAPGHLADIIATEYGFSRDEADALAVESQNRAAAAWDDNRFAKSVVAVQDQNGLTILDRDEYMRPGTDMQSAGRAEPRVQGHGRGHAGL